MNQVLLIGRMTKDPDIHRTEGKSTVARFSIAINRGKDKDGNDRGADFPNIVCFGKTAELVEKYLGKGRLVGITGSIQTGSYEKDGTKYYTTDVLASRVEFLDKAGAAETTSSGSALQPGPDDVPAGFEQIDVDEIPF